MLKENQPITAEFDKCRKLANNLWYFKGKFMIKALDTDDTPTYYIYNKFEEGKGKDLVWFAKTLGSVRDMLSIMNEDIKIEICEDLRP